MDKHLAAVAPAVLLLLLGVSGGTSAQGQQESAGYLYSSPGIVARDNLGNCVRSNIWTPELATAECHPELVKKPEEVATAEPAEPEEPLAAFETITLETKTLFDFDKDELRPEGRQKLDELVSELQGEGRVGSITVVGHTDSIGTEEYNEDLSQRRAASVSEYLVQQGVDPTRIETEAKGETQPVADNSTAEGRQQNRRVEIEVPVQRRAER